MSAAKKPVPWPYWPFWMLALAIALFVFYVVLTPVWMGIRAVAWLSERGASLGSRRGGRR